MNATSPFLPGTKVQFAWDSTSLSYLKTCPRLYQYIMLEGYASKDESIHLRFGQEYHKALEDYDRLRAEDWSHGDALRVIVKELLVRIDDWSPDTDTKAGKYKNPLSLLRMVIDYLDKYEDDPAKTFILQDGKPAVELSFRFELDWGPKRKIESHPAHPIEPIGQPFLLCGHLDRVVTFQDFLFVMDRKTTTYTLSSSYFSQYEPNNQMTLYSLAAKVVLASPIKGVIIDGAQILVDSSAFARGFTYRTQDQLEEWLNDLRFWFGMAERYAEAGYWPMNDTSCGMYGGCRFRGICSKAPQVRERFLKAQFTQLPEEERWNPLKTRGGPE